MKYDYEASREVLVKSPPLTYATRLQNFLIYPASGRNEKQLFLDYQDMVTTNLGNEVLRNNLQMAYVIGLARTQPRQAIRWAQENIDHFKTQPETRVKLFSRWLQLDESAARQWLRLYPDGHTVIEEFENRSVILEPTQNVEAKPSLTLPR